MGTIHGFCASNQVVDYIVRIKDKPAFTIRKDEESGEWQASLNNINALPDTVALQHIGLEIEKRHNY